MTVPATGLDPLLDRIVRDALDPSYAAAASRRHAEVGGATAAAGHPTLTRARLAGLVLLVAVGAVAGIAVSLQHKMAPQVGAARGALAGDAAARTRQVKALEQTLASRERELDALRQRQLATGTTDGVAQRQLAALAGASAQTPVRGPGVTITLTDVKREQSPSAGSRPTGSGGGVAGVVADRDLQAVVNALWAGGADAVAVGGIRLGPQTAIRTAGQTILVDFRAIRSPYVISAIGPPTLSAFLTKAPAVALLRQGAPRNHPVVAIRTQESLSLPAASSTALSLGRPLPAGGHS